MKKITLFLFCGLLGIAGIFYSCEDTIEEDPNEEEEGLEQSAWTKHEAPVLEKGGGADWDEGLFGFPSVVYVDGVYHLWYSATKPNSKFAIGHATSEDGISWTKDPANPVLEKGASGSWDEKWVYIPSVLHVGSTFHMYYIGRDMNDHERIGYATSPDAVVWKKHPGNPVLKSGTTGSWDAGHTGPGAVIYLNDTFHMWYNASSSFGSNVFKIGYATSPDGTSWTRHPDNPVMDNGGMGNWDHPRTQAASVIFNGSDYEMWYGGGLFMAWKIGHATSPDGIQWERDVNNPVLNVGASGTWDDKYVAFPSVIYDSTSLKYKMWYHGLDSKEIAAIGYAEKDTN